MILKIRKVDLFDTKINGRHMTYWNNMTFKHFRPLTNWKQLATWKRIEFPMNYQNGLPSSIFAENYLWGHLHWIFCTASWCETLSQSPKYMRVPPPSCNSSFRQRQATIAVQNFSLSLHFIIMSLMLCAILIPHQSRCSDLVVFISKAPPLPVHRRSNQICQKNQYYRGHPPNNRSTCRSWMRT